MNVKPFTVTDLFRQMSSCSDMSSKATQSALKELDKQGFDILIEGTRNGKDVVSLTHRENGKFMSVDENNTFSILEDSGNTILEACQNLLNSINDKAIGVFHGMKRHEYQMPKFDKLA